ncbi:hypothetical protein BTO32_15050 [Marinobacter lutaoensis]|uniref:PEGA domain-containing protein n=1 Tax=Marinobacter lutaoensis TaxID=135739 RepID=A0A1V2DPI1_9GAMM|nr:hypothetical protein [Marinobacter lutaoensis]ONF42527.1 hypothetical protein BTO32_15050 [Marinobacter lutaoensis]
MKFKGFVAGALAMTLLSGCSTVIKGTSESITVNSLEDGTTIYVNGAARGKDSAFVNLEKGKVHTITARKEGCEPATTQTGESFDPTTLLGILIDWGLITIPVDLISGAAWEITPTTYTVTPICPGSNAVATSQ